jgi:hypothetical protein
MGKFLPAFAVKSEDKSMKECDIQTLFGSMYAAK